MQQDDIFTYTLLPDDTYEAKLCGSTLKDTYTMKDTYQGKPITVVKLTNINGYGKGIKKFSFGKFVREVSYVKLRSREMCLFFKEVYIPSSMIYIPEFLLNGSFPTLTKFDIDKNHKRYKVINNCLVDVIDKTLLRMWRSGDIPDVPEIENISRYVFKKCPIKMYVRAHKNIKRIDHDAFENGDKDVNFRFDENEVNENFETIKGCIIEKETRTLLKYTLNEPIVDLRDVKINCICQNAFRLRNKIEEVYLPEGLTQIKKRAFLGCTSLKHIKLPSTLKIVGKSAFESCYKLQELVFPKDMLDLPVDVMSYCPSLKKIIYPLVANVTRPIWYYAKETKLPFNNTCTLSICLLGDKFDEIVIPKEIRQVTLLQYDFAHIKRLVLEGAIFDISIDDRITVDEIIFKDKNSEYEFSGHTLYRKTDLELSGLFIPENVYEYEVPESLEYLGDCPIHGGKNLEKLIFDEEIRCFRPGESAGRPHVKYIDIKNPDFDFEGLSVSDNDPLINIDLTKSDRYEKIEGCIVDKFSHKCVAYYKRNSVQFEPKDYKEFVMLSKQNKFKPKGHWWFLGTETLKDEVGYNIERAFRDNSLYYMDEGELKETKGFAEQFVANNYCVTKMPAKIDTKRKAVLEILATKADREIEYSIFIPKNIYDFGMEAMSYFMTAEKLTLDFDKDHKTYKVENGILINRQHKSTVLLLKGMIKNNEVKIPQGVKELKLEGLDYHKEYIFYIPRSVEDIYFRGNIDKFKFIIDEKNPYYYVKENTIYNKKTDEVAVILGS